jgi:hypothetical protein
MTNRFAISSITFAALLLFIALQLGAPSIYFAILSVFDIPRVAQPFSDLGAVLQAVHCAGQGVDVYAPNACMNGGNYNYSAFLLHFSMLGGLAVHLNLAGLGLGVLFVVALVMLPAPQSREEFWLRTLASVSASTAFAVERMNLDVIIFLFAMAGIWLVLRGGVAKLVGYVLFGIGAALKYYPVALLVLLLREPPRRLALIVALLALVGLGGVLRFGAGIEAALAAIPHGPPFGNCFGAIDIPLGISLGVAALHGDDLRHLANIHMPLVLYGVYGAMILFALWRGWAGTVRYCPVLEKLDAKTQAYLIAGAALICACFFMAQNIDYRAIFLLLALPGAAVLDRPLAIAIVVLMWESFFRIATISVMPHLLGQAAGYSVVIMVWLAREVLWWWVVTRFLALLFLYAREKFLRVPA